MTVALHWFRRDLRLDDNVALCESLRQPNSVIPLYIFDETFKDVGEGSASRWWLHYSLEALNQDLERRGSGLILKRGEALSVLEALISECGVSLITWNRCYAPEEINRDRRIKQHLRTLGVRVESFNGTLLREPWTHLKSDGTPYRVFTPFFKHYLEGLPGRKPVTVPDRFPTLPQGLTREPLAAFSLRPKIAWDSGLRSTWQPGERGALRRLESFVEEPIKAYRSHRDVPSLDATSGLSPHLHFGEISVSRILERVLSQQDPDQEGVHTFLKELGWREFAYSMLFHFPFTQHNPLDERFRDFPWRSDYARDLLAWQRGETGFPIVDAGMRQLWHTGWMHNRVRMIVASFLTKNLLIPWQEGAAWFTDTLVDADAASNTFGWQWTAGCGADAAPYFRVFNPILQGEKFDPDGLYVQRWIPELAARAKARVHRPIERDPARPVLSGIEPARIGYPEPIVELSSSRARALRCYEEMRRSRGQ